MPHRYPDLDDPDLELVHPLPVEAAAGWFAAMRTAFLEPPVDPDRMAALQRFWFPDRRWGVRDTRDGRWLGTFGTHERLCSVPGGDLPADAVTMVTVAATHRRRGLLTAMMTAGQRSARERGDVLSILVAAEWAIYGRFGYSPAAWRSHLELDPRLPGNRPGPSPTTVRQVDRAQFAAAAPAIYDAARRQRAGSIDRPDDHWVITLGLDGAPGRPEEVYVLHPEGFLRWWPIGSTGAGEPSAVEIGELVAATDRAARDLWCYVLNLDLAERVRAPNRPVDEPLRWLLPDGRAVDPITTSDGLWVRLLDLPRALAGRRYAVSGRLVLDVVDDAPGGYAAGRVVLEGGPDGASCRPTTASPDLTLGQRTLASAYLGGVSLAAQAAGPGRAVDEHTRGALATFEAMLATAVAPWSMTDF